MKSSIRTLFVVVALGFAALGFAVDENLNVMVVAEDEVAAPEPQTGVDEDLDFGGSYVDMFSELLAAPGYRGVISEPWRSVSSAARTDIVLVIPTA